MTEQAENVITPVGMLAFDKFLFEADEKGKFRAALLIDADKDIKDLKVMIKAAAVGKWGEKVDMKKINLPYKTADEDAVEERPFLEGKMVFNAGTKFDVPVVDGNNDTVFRADIKGGDTARFSVSAYAWEFQKKKGVGLNLLAVQKHEDGEALFQKTDASKIFGKVVSAEVEDDIAY